MSLTYVNKSKYGKQDFVYFVIFCLHQQKNVYIKNESGMYVLRKMDMIIKHSFLLALLFDAKIRINFQN